MAASGERDVAASLQSLRATRLLDVDDLIGRLDSFRQASGVLLAVSGGPDSTALMHLTSLWCRQNSGPKMIVATVDHGLRPDARDEADQVVASAHRLGFDAVRLTWAGDKPKRGLPARARAARYDLLLAQARACGASQIVTAHTLDDQMETVLMRLARGSGPAGLAGMRESVDLGGVTLERPFLGVRKARLVALCTAFGWSYVEDPTNIDPAYARARWRRLASVLATEGLTPELAGSLARRMARADDALQRWTAELSQQASHPRDGAGRRLSMDQLAGVPDEIYLRVLAASLVEVSGRDQPKLKALEKLGDELTRAFREGRRCRRTFHHCVVALASTGVVDITPEPPRRRGRRPPLQHEISPAAANDAAPCPSLGNATPPAYIGQVVAPVHVTDMGETHGASAVTAREPLLSTGPQ